MDSNSDPWAYLGYKCIAKALHLTRGDIQLDIDPENFQSFLISASFDPGVTSILINRQIEAILELPTGETPVTLSFDYEYILNDQLSISSNNSAELGRSLSGCIHLIYITQPRFAKVGIQPYNGHAAGHQSGLDTEVHYRWTTEVGGLCRKLLRLRMVQDPLPVPCAGAPLTAEWHLIATDQCSRNRWMHLELHVHPSMTQLFIDTIPAGVDLRVREKLMNSHRGVRAANAYTPNGLVQCVQIMTKSSGDNPPYLAFTMEQVFLLNRNFMNKRIQIFYRWRGGVLELAFKTEQDVDMPPGA